MQLSRFAHRFCFFALQTLRARLVNAEWLFRHEITTRRVGARATAHANVPEFAATAFAFQPADVAQFMKNGRVLPNVNESLFPQVARDHGKISAGKDFSFGG